MKTLKNRVDLMALVLAASLSFVGCGEADEPATCDANCEAPDEQEDGLEVAGEWETNFGGQETITEEVWGPMLLTEYDNTTREAITQNAPDAEYGPNTYNVIVWTEPVDDSFYYCMVAFDQETVEEAREIEAEADASDPDNGGCGGFSWTKMTRL